ncbi:MAG: S-adenosyl-L-methionine:L-histidine 3-amino-3-carboxypropyltransferase [archaeon]|jgi:2-(3-amino-3-carboxypropyl)histidine synthase
MVELFFVDAKFEGKITVSEKLKKFLGERKPKRIALFAAVQFSQLDDFVQEVEKLKIKVLTTKAKRTAQPLQILGCDCYSDSFNEPIIDKADMILYVGDGLFHPKALLLAQIDKNNKNKTKEKMKPVVLYDPLSDSVKELSGEAIEKQLLRAKANVKKYLHAQHIGILVTIKPGQQYLYAAKQLKEKLAKDGKKGYIFIDNTFDLSALENYPFIDAWVNTACPRIGTDDIVNINKPMINIREAFDPIKALEMME